jgi:hypothetical protein
MLSSWNGPRMQEQDQVVRLGAMLNFTCKRPAFLRVNEVPGALFLSGH